MGRTATKLEIRSDLIKYMKENKEEDLKNFINYATLPQVQASIKLYIKYLKQKQ